MQTTQTEYGFMYVAEKKCQHLNKIHLLSFPIKYVQNWHIFFFFSFYTFWKSWLLALIDIQCIHVNKICCLGYSAITWNLWELTCVIYGKNCFSYSFWTCFMETINRQYFHRFQSGIKRCSIVENSLPVLHCQLVGQKVNTQNWLWGFRRWWC